MRQALQQHLFDHYTLYGEHAGVRSARKHIGWYVADLPAGEQLRQQVNGIESAAAQMQAVDAYLAGLQQQHARLPAPPPCRKQPLPVA